MKSQPLPQSQESIEARFEPRDDDNENLWEVIAIIGEKNGSYRVEWAGSDPKTGKPWSPSWVRKGDVTDDLVVKWKLEKKRKKADAAAKKAKKSGKRASTTSTTTATVTTSRPTSTRASVSVRKGSTPTATVVAPNGDRRATEHKIVPSRSADTLGRTKNELDPSDFISTSSDKDSDRPTKTVKRKREPSWPKAKLNDDDTTPTRPRKKRRLDRIGESSEEERYQDRRRRVKAVRRRPRLTPFDDTEEDEEEERVRTTRINVPKAVNYYEEEESAVEEVEVVSTKPAKIGSPPPPPSSQQQQHVNRLIKVKRTGEAPLKNGLWHKPPKPTSSLRHPTATKQRKDSTARNAASRTRELSPSTLERLRQFDAELEDLERARRKQEELEAEAEAQRIREQERLLEQAQAQREDDEISALEYCEENTAPDVDHQTPQLPHPLSEEVPDPSFLVVATNVNPNSNPGLAATMTTAIPTATAPNSKITPNTASGNKPRFSNADSCSLGIVPETEFEDSSGNTQSQSKAGRTNPASPPSMVVEPPTSLRSPPQTPSRSRSAVLTTIISKMRPRTPSSRVGSMGSVGSAMDLVDVGLQTPDVMEFNRIEEEDREQDGASNAPAVDGERQEGRPENIWSEKDKDKDTKNEKNGTGKLGSFPLSTIKGPLTSGVTTGGDGVEDITSSIEQFSSPEKRRIEVRSISTSEIDDRKGKPTITGTARPRAGRSSTSELGAIQRRGKELAEVARQAKLKSLERASKKPLEEVLRQRKMASQKSDVRVGGVRHGAANNTTTGTAPVTMQEDAPPSSIKTAPSSSLPVPDSDRGLPEVLEDVVKQMEVAYVDLEGGSGSANKTVDDDTTVDDSNSASVGKVVAGGVSAVALRQEEEESTQDLLMDARIVGEGEGEGSGLSGDPDEVCFVEARVRSCVFNI
ncbi:hypothetical protein AX15_007928 [Amanita polypyramis BW_CC]|nr:hypothetical protein AX15_007928 [Amanita polypyramis BW_CC]